jgi:hypothetical protein
VKPPQAAELTAESMRALNRAMTADGYERPTEVYAVVVELTLLVRELPKVLGQTAAWLDAEHDAGRVGCDDGCKPTLTVHGAVMGLHDAARHPKPLLQALNAAARHASDFTGRTR